MRKRIMPLRVRLIVSTGLVLLVSLACGSVLVGWHAANSVRTELSAALDVGVKTIRNGIDGDADDWLAVSRHLVATFNGNRHVRALLVDGDNRPLAVSTLFASKQPVPAWFRDLIGGEAGLVRLGLPRTAAAIVLRTDASNEIGEVWAESRDAVLVLAGFAGLSTLLICMVVGRALRPLETLSKAFGHVAAGNYHGSVREHGPPELRRLASGFNVMTQRLATVAAQNRRLNERLLTLQSQERADLARDLHDEIGPLLFAVTMTAATIERLAGNGRGGDIPPQVRSIQEAVGRMQRHVRVLLGRLRPIQAIGLAASIERLAAFWRGRDPGVHFHIAIAIEEDRIGDDLKETIYRVVQEGVSNAIRHGKPARVDIVVVHAGAGAVRVEVADDGIGMLMDGTALDGVIGRDPAQLGLIGMRERVMAMAGSLTIEHGRDRRGMALVAWLPNATSVHDQNVEDPE